MRRTLVLAILLGGCIDAVAPDVGPLARAPCHDDDSDPATPVRFADLHDGVFARDDVHCLRCHSPDGATPLGLEVGGLDLSTAESVNAGARTGFQVIVPGHPCDSVLVQKIGEAPPFGARMPLDGPPFVGDDDLRLVSDWIAEGAHAD